MNLVSCCRGGIRGKFERRLGVDLGGVRVHSDARAERSAVYLQANAYTVGEHMVVASDRAHSDSRESQRTYAHELAHILQQRSAPNRATLQRETAKECISRHTSWGNLHEEALGQALASRAVAAPELLMRVLTQLSSSDRDDVAEVIVASLSDANLAACDERLLQRLQTELAGRIFSTTTDSESQAIGRLDAAIRTRSLTQPIVTPAPAQAISIEDFIALLEAEEGKVAAEEQTNTRLMISRFRKLFYGSQGWDEHLIPGAKDVRPLYQFQEQETGRRAIEMPGLPNLTEYIQRVPRLIGAPEALRDPSRVQEVRMPDGTFVDVGHVLAGLDALNHPTSVSVPVLANIGIRRNVDAVTWVGDLGSVLAEAVLKAVESERSIGISEYQDIINEYASAQDMLGNIDAYVVGDAFAINTSSGLKVSEMLRRDYLGDNAARARRFSRFGELIGLGGFAGGLFANEEAWIEGYLDDVNDAAALYLAAQTDSAFFGATLLQRGWAVLGLAMNQGSELLLRLFVQQLRAQASTES